MTDKKINIILAIYIAAAVFVLVAGLTRFINPVFLPWLNILSAVTLTAYWLRRYLVRPHRVEQRELVFICTELICIVASLVFICKLSNAVIVLVVQYLILILHLLAASVLLLFFTLFKIKKLF
jgi:hypothetical protein